MSEPKKFVFNDENLEAAKKIIAKYPEGKQRSAILPLFDLAQRQNNGYISQDIIEYVAEMVGIPAIRAHEVASFYTMFNLKPVGQYHVQICGTTPCWLRGSDNIKKACQDKLGIEVGQTTSDGIFTLSEVECLGACVNAPIVQINDDYYEDLDPEIMQQILADLRAGKAIRPGSQIGRVGSAPRDFVKS